MNNIFLAPRANETSRANFVKTIGSGGVPYSFVEPHLSTEEKKALAPYPALQIWGTSLENRWEAMGPGDYVLFYGGKHRFNYSARVILTKKSDALGRNLWALNKKGEPWHCIFFVDQVTEINIPIQALQGLAGYEPTWDRVQGFMKLNKAGTEAITEQFGGIEGFIGQPTQVFDAIELVLENTGEETVESEVETKEDPEQLLKDALAYRSTGASHTESTSPKRVRIENRVQKKRIAKIEGYACQICNWSMTWTNKKGKTFQRIDIDHIVDKSKGGGEEASNLWALCPNCHAKKTFGVITINLKKKLIQENGQTVELHHDSHLEW